MKLKHIKQPEESSLCGQCCVAMLCGISLQDAILAVGHAHGTRTREIVRALERHGCRVGGRRGGLKRIRMGDQFPKTGIFKMLPLKGIKSRKSHWLVIHDGRIYDPGCPPGEISEGRLSSYLEVQDGKL